MKSFTQSQHDTTDHSPATGISIERCPHDKSNPYTMVHNALIRDESISPNCRWLLIYLLSNDEKVWTIKISQIISHLKGHLGKNRVYNLFDEAIQAGYIKRHNYLENNLKRSKYIVSETPKFKKSFLLPQIRDAEGEDPENHDALEGTSKESLSLRNNISNPPPLSSPQKSPKAKEISPIGSEAEELHSYDFLEGTNLSPKDKLRLTKQFSREQVLDAIKISETQKIKKTLMHLLLNILQNPDKWPDASENQLEPHHEHIAREYNKSLASSKKLAREPLMKPGAKSHETRKCSDIAKENDKSIKDNHMKIILNGFITQVSLSSTDFAKDIKDAIAQLR